MNTLEAIFNNIPLWAAILAWAIAQIIKFTLELIRRRRVNLFLFFSSGGMPSSHTAFVTSLAAATGLSSGFDSPVFALAAALSLIVMYDAAGVRRAAGKHAAAINTIYDILEDPDVSADEKLKELLGHSPLEVAAGAVLGVLVGCLVIR